jgi:hypothetical protein
MPSRIGNDKSSYPVITFWRYHCYIQIVQGIPFLQVDVLETIRTPRLMSHHSSKTNPSYNISLHHLLHPVLFYLHNNFLIYSAICYTSYHSISEVSFTRTKDKQTPTRPTTFQLRRDIFVYYIGSTTNVDDDYGLFYMISDYYVNCKLHRHSTTMFSSLPRHPKVCTEPSYRLQPTSEHAWEPVRGCASRRSVKSKQGETVREMVQNVWTCRGVHFI